MGPATPARLLVVEDDAALVEALCDQLQGLGHTAVAARSVADGLALLLGNQHRKFRVGQLASPLVFAVIGEEQGEVGRLVEMTECLREGIGAEDRQAGRVVGPSQAESDIHAPNPAGSGQPSGRIAITLNSSPISSSPQSRSTACSTS